MTGISSSGKEKIASAVEEIFDKIALHFIGNIPKLQNKKLVVISSQPNLGLSNLFVQAMNNRKPNEIEKDALKSLLNSSHGYVESLKAKTQSKITQGIDGLAKEASLRNEKVDQSAVQSLIDEEMSKAQSQMKAIVEAESTKFRNIGSLMDISRVSSSLGDADPTVFFVVVRDNVTCKECIRLHLEENGVTPRLWKFSQLKQGYHKRGENNPSAFGEHPHCRCTLTYLSKGFGFNKDGKIEYKSQNYDAYQKQK